MTQTIKFKNTSKTSIKLHAIGLRDVPPNGEIDVPIELAAPVIRDNGSRGQSPIEKCAPQMQPVDPQIKEVWISTPSALPQRSLVASTQRRDPDEAPGVRALREAAKPAATPAKE